MIISHLQFVDGTIIFANNDMEEILNFKTILKSFQVLSETKINWTKSMITGVGVEGDLVNRILVLLCPVKLRICP